jgi:putative transposase
MLFATVSKEVKTEGDVVGVELGPSSFAILSGRTWIEAPKPKKGSNNGRKAALLLARLHRKVKHLR